MKSEHQNVCEKLVDLFKEEIELTNAVKKAHNEIKSLIIRTKK